MNLENQNICYCHDEKIVFPNLSAAYQFILDNHYRCFDVQLEEIVEYNLRYRDYLRANGIDQLIELLISEEPRIKDEIKLLDSLREWYERIGPLADYDVQCLPIYAPFEVLGHRIEGLSMVRERTEYLAWDRYCDFEILRRAKRKEAPDKLHFGLLFEDYPRFDSSDFYDDRYYMTFLIRNRYLTDSDMKYLFNVYKSHHIHQIHEKLPKNLLPMLYYEGSGQFMLLASEKNN